jgi:hypothetical protein
LQIKNTKNIKSEVRFKQFAIRGAFTIDSSTPTLKGNLHEHTIHKSVWTNYENRMGRNLRKKKNVEKDGIGFLSRKKMNNKTV